MIEFRFTVTVDVYEKDGEEFEDTTYAEDSAIQAALRDHISSNIGIDMITAAGSEWKVEMGEVEND
jgi:hypothetical protein